MYKFFSFRCVLQDRFSLALFITSFNLGTHIISHPSLQVKSLCLHLINLLYYTTTCSCCWKFQQKNPVMLKWKGQLFHFQSLEFESSLKPIFIWDVVENICLPISDILLLIWNMLHLLAGACCSNISFNFSKSMHTNLDPNPISTPLFFFKHQSINLILVSETSGHEHSWQI